MTDDQNLFLKYVGPRFAGGRMPVDVLSDLSAFQEIIVGFAKRKWLERNPGRQRVPSGFDKSIAFSLTSIGDGSAIPNIKLDEYSIQQNLPGMQDQIQELVDESYEETVSYIDGATDTSNVIALSPPQVRAFNKFGAGLALGERIEFNRKSQVGDNVVYLNADSRKALITRVRETYEKKYQSIGAMHGYSLDGRVEVKTREYGVVHIPVEVEEVRAKFIHASERLVQFDVTIELDHQDRYKSITEVVECDLVDEGLSVALRNAQGRLSRFEQLQPGWLRGNGLIISKDSIDRTRQLIALRPYFMESLHVFPNARGGITIEGEVGSFDVMIEIRHDGAVEVDAFSDGHDDLGPVAADHIGNDVLSILDKVFASLSSEDERRV